MEEKTVEGGIESIRELLEYDSGLTTENTVLRNGVLISQLSSSNQVSQIVKNMDGKIHGNQKIHVLPLDQYKQILNREDRDYIPLKEMSERDLLAWQFGLKDEHFLIGNDDGVTLYQNCRSGNVREIYSERGSNLLATISDSGKFIAIASKEGIHVRGGKECEVFNELNVQKVKSMRFSDDDKYLVIYSNDSQKDASIWDIYTRKLVFSEDVSGREVRFIDKNSFYLVGTNLLYVFKGEGFVRSEELNGIELNGVSEISAFKDCMAILTNDRIKNILFIPEARDVVKKNYANLENVQFSWSENCMYAFITKKAGDRNVYMVEGFSRTGELISTNLDGKMVDWRVSDDFFVYFNEEYELRFYGRANKRFKELNVVAKKSRVILSMNKKGAMSAIYDYDDDTVEFYDKGELISVHSHPGCTHIEWAISGLYVAVASIGPQMSGQVQMFDVNGRQLWKRIFNMLASLQWRGFVEIEDSKAKEKILRDHKMELEQIGEEEGRFWLSPDSHEDASLRDMAMEWKRFILSKRASLRG
jgi:hypothetical protein